MYAEYIILYAAARNQEVDASHADSFPHHNANTVGSLLTPLSYVL